MRKVEAAILAITAVAAAQLLGSVPSPTPKHPGTMFWYARLRKPSYMPAVPAFAIVWTALDSLLGFTGYRLLRMPGSSARTAALGFWAATVGCVAGFSWVLFGRKTLGGATMVAGGTLAAATGTAVAASRVDRVAAVAGLPLIGWCAFATMLQADVWRRNST